MDLQATIRTRRKALKISQEDLAQMAEVGLATVKDIERGKSNPSLATITRLLEVLGLEIKYVERDTE
ncbi:MAG: helix-turn-helix transcriptional regulator [Bacteroidales bacterium]|jgi:y4mF family transcriptional regulator|nr:helix-turn-helix transcriptional regulator [Bacteroidales bacterium]